ncbi:hypothetical protein Aduo_013696 [Ancylostoma duodenale]
MDEISPAVLEGIVKPIFAFSTEAFDGATGKFLPLNPPPLVRCDLEAGDFDVPCGRAFGGAHDIFSHLRHHVHAYPLYVDAHLVEFLGAPTETILTYEQVWVGLPRLPKIAARLHKAAMMEFNSDKYTGLANPRSIFYHDDYE